MLEPVKRRLFYSGTIVVAFLLGLLPGKMDGMHRDRIPGDTVKAVVSYGDDYLFQTADAHSDNYFNYILDSLQSLDPVPQNKVKEVQFYRSIQYKSATEINNLIDSLFELDTVPFALINEINRYVAINYDFEADAFGDNYVFVPQDDSPYPANAFYQKWNTRETHPYSSKLSQGDSLLMLRLRDAVNFCDYAFPLDGEIKVTSKFGYRDGRSHNGVDFDLHVWDPVKTSFAGMVRYARFHEGYGRLVVVRHYNGLETYYAHLHRLKVKPGDMVEAGDVIGLGGSSGNSTGSHLHYEVRFKGLPINPAHIINIKEGTLLGDTLVLRKTRHSYIAYQKGTQFHTVQRGDSPYRIAKRYGVPLEQIKELNGFSGRTHLRLGQKVRISNHPL